MRVCLEYEPADAAVTPAYELPIRWRRVRAAYRLLLRLRLKFMGTAPRLEVEVQDGRTLIVLPGVFNGVRLRTGAFLAATLDATLVPAGARVLDLGTGSGIGALAAAPWAGRVIATDINPEAVRCAAINALLQHLEHIVETRVGDLFAPVCGEQFDVILFNPPFYRGQPRDLPDHAWRSPDVFDRFLQALPAYLRENGRAVIVLSSDGDIAAALGEAAHLQTHLLRRHDFVNEILSVYELSVAHCGCTHP
jgi:16S rRNA G1207 methylase RsmC